MIPRMIFQGGGLLSEDEYKSFVLSILAKTSGKRPEQTAYDKFVGELICHSFDEAMGSLEDLLMVDEDYFWQRNRLEAITKEVQELGDEVVSANLNYILYQEATEKEFENGVRDKGRAGERFQNFLDHEFCKKAKLNDAEVLALRLYTTPAFKHINDPLRQKVRTRHPLAYTVFCIREGIKKLRKIESVPGEKMKPVTLWRGLKNTKTSDRFMDGDGAEVCVSM
jgi:hypothetical protein